MQSPTRTRIFSPGVIHNRKHHSYFHCTISSISFGPLIAAYSIVVILLLFLENFSQIQARLADRSKLLPNATNATNPLVYKRLRLEQDALQVLGRFQRYFLRDEHKVRFSFNETLLADEDHPSNRTQLVEHYYYQNDHIEINSLTYDDLIFEAIDASYLTKLLPYFVASYDNKADLARASDKRLVSRSRCNKELDYLLEQLLELEHARYDSSHRMGAQLSGSLNAEVLTLLDAFGTEQPGLLMGNHYWPGNWRQCRKSRLFHRDHLHPESSVDFGARYCVASLRSQRWNTLAAERVRELDARKHFEHDHQRVNYARYHRLQIGICLPESCDSRILSSRYENIQKLATYKLSEPLRSYELVDLYCLPDETSELRKLEPASILLLIFLGLWVGAVTLATVIDVRSRGNKFQSHPLELSGVVGQVPATGAKSSKQAASGKTAVEKLVDCLSFMRNLERIFETDSLKPRPVVGGLTVKASESNSQLPDKRHPDEQLIERSTTTTITATCQLSTSEQTATSNSNNQNHHKLQFNKFQFLNCAKVLANWSIIFGHVGMLLMHTHEYTLDYDCYNVWVLHYAFSSAIFVDWHFAISGLLVTYSTFSGNRIQRHTTWSWLGTIVHRYLRLAPLYLLMFSFSQSLFMYTGEGPLWDYSTSNQTVRATCRRESLLYPLTLTSNLHPIYEECVVPSWYISSDFQFFLITPFLFVLLYKSPLLGWLVGLGIIGASSAARYHRYSTDERADLLGLMRPRYDLYKRNNWDMYPTYLQPQYRIGSYMVGMLTGHYIHMVLSGRWTSHLAPPKSQLGNNQAAIASRKKVRLPMELSNLGLDTPTTKQSGILNSVCSYGALITSCFIIIQTFFCTYFLLYTVPSEWDPYADYIVPVLYSIAHTVAALGFALFAVLIVLGNFTHIRNFMSLPIWSVLVRFNFILFIAQIEAIHWIIGSGDTMPVLSTIELFKVFICVMCLLYLISGIFTPLFELPISLIERNFIAPLFAPPPPPPPPSGSQQYQLAQKSNSETLEASSPVPTRRANSLANTTTGAGGNPKQAYELGHIAAGESIRLVSDQQQ